MFKLNDPTVDSGFVAEAVEAQPFSFKYSCGVDKGRKWKPSQMKSQGSRFRDGGGGGGERGRQRRRRKNRRRVSRETRALWKRPSGKVDVDAHPKSRHSKQTKGLFLLTRVHSRPPNRAQ